MQTDIVHTTFHFQIPEGKILSILSVTFPHLRFYLQSMLPLSKSMGSSLIQVQGSGLVQFATQLPQIMSNVAYTLLHDQLDSLLLHVQMDNPWFLLTIIKTNLILKFPLVVQNNRIYVDMVATRQKIDQLFAEFDLHAVPYIITRIGKFIASPLLSTRQEFVLQLAVELGYFDIPRKISLSQLAHRLEITPASLSQALRRIYRSLSRQYFQPYVF